MHRLFGLPHSLRFLFFFFFLNSSGVAPTAVLCCFSLTLEKGGGGDGISLEYHPLFCLSGMRLGRSLSAFLYSR